MPKNISQSKIKWLMDELPELHSQQLIDESTVQKLTEYYQTQIKEKPAGQRYFLLTLIILGTLLVSGGVILLFAHNWDMLKKSERVSIAFIPLILGACSGVYTIIKEKDARWREFSALFTSAAFAILIALISQIYHIGGQFDEYMKLVLLLALPLVYIFESQMLTIAYCLGLFSLYGFDAGTSALIRLAYLGGIVPYIYLRLFHKPFDGITIWMRYIVLIPLVFFTFVCDESMWLISFIITTAMLLVGGLVYSYGGIRGWKNPWLIAGWSSFTILITIGSVSRHFWNSMYFHGYNNEHSALLLMGILILFFIVGVIFAVREWTPLKLMTMLFPLLALLRYYGFIDPVPMFWIANAYFAAFGIMTLLNGMRARDLFEMNAGMLQLVLLISFKFFDAQIGIISRAIVFIIIGLFFIVTNIYLGRYFKKSEVISCTEKKNG